VITTTPQKHTMNNLAERGFDPRTSGFFFFFFFKKGEIPTAFDRRWTTLYNAPEQFTATGICIQMVDIYMYTRGYNAGSRVYNVTQLHTHVYTMSYSVTHVIHAIQC